MTWELDIRILELVRSRRGASSVRGILGSLLSRLVLGCWGNPRRRKLHATGKRGKTYSHTQTGDSEGKTCSLIVLNYLSVEGVNRPKELLKSRSVAGVNAREGCSKADGLDSYSNDSQLCKL